MRNKMLLNRRMASVLLVVCVIALFTANPLAQQPAGNSHVLKPTPKTVAWGYYDASAPPVLRIKSGDTVEIETVITNSPSGLGAAGLAPEAGVKKAWLVARPLMAPTRTNAAR